MMKLNIGALVGKTLVGAKETSDEIIFECVDGGVYKLYHDQDCCENVRVEEVIGDLDDLVGAPVVQAEETSNEGHPEPEGCDSFTWTFYKLATNKGSVTIRFLGTSNGYYSERVDFGCFVEPRQKTLAEIAAEEAKMVEARLRGFEGRGW